MDPLRRWASPPFKGGVGSCLPSAPPKPSFPALYRQDTTSWNTDGRENKLSEAMTGEVEGGKGTGTSWEGQRSERGTELTILNVGAGRERLGMEKASILIFN